MWGASENLGTAKRSYRAKKTIRIPTPHSKQIEILKDQHRFKILSCGRRFGKSVLLEVEALEELLKSGHRVAYLAPTFTMLLDWHGSPLTGKPSTKARSGLICAAAIAMALCVAFRMLISSISSESIIPIPIVVNSEVVSSKNKSLRFDSLTTFESVSLL